MIIDIIDMPSLASRFSSYLNFDEFFLRRVAVHRNDLHSGQGNRNQLGEDISQRKAGLAVVQVTGQVNYPLPTAAC